MPSNLSNIDLATLNVAREVIVSALRDRSCQWEQDSTDAAEDGQLSTALIFQNWAFAADLLSSTVSSGFTDLFCAALDARLGTTTSTHRSIENQVLDALALEIVSAQPAPS